MKKPTVAVIIPTIRDLNFLKSWKGEFGGCIGIIIEDRAIKTIQTPRSSFASVYHYAWDDIERDFGEHSWIVSRRNAGVRTFGFWKAYELGADIIITLDDDCYPVENGFVHQHVENLSQRAPEHWTNTYPHPSFIYTRGVPYLVRNKKRTVVSHGLWTNKIDLDGKTEIKHPNLNLPAYPPLRQFIPAGAYFPMCSMNLAFRREITPLMYFPLMGADPKGNLWGYDRFDDIWAGIFAKKIIDHLGWAAVNGSPFVEHRKASDPHKNVLKEQKGLVVNEWLWKRVDEATLTKETPADCYQELAQTIRFPKDTYFDHLREAMMYWGGLFHE